MCRIVLFAVILPWFCDAPADAQADVFFGNLHSHTSYSDGSDTPEEAYRHARDVAGLDFLAITEHNHPQAGRIANDPTLYNGTTSVSLIQTANRFNVDGTFVAMFGQEFSSISSGNHANVFEVGQVIPVSIVPNGRWDNLLNTWIPANPDATGSPALLLLNHPATSGSPNGSEYGRDDFATTDAWRTALDARAQLINIINGPSHNANGDPGRPSESEFRRYLNLGFHLAPTADQDNHRPNWGSAAETRTGVISASLTKTNILAALRARNVYATEDRNLRVIPRIEGHLIGTRVSGAAVPVAGSVLDVSIEIEDPDEPLVGYEIDVFADTAGGDDADILATFVVTGNGTFSLAGISYPGGEHYLFFRVRQMTDDVAGHDRVWTAPVWFEPAGAPAPTAIATLTLTVDVHAETAVIQNLGTAAVDLSGWQVVSTRGNQTFTFPSTLQLAPGATVTVRSGPGAQANPPSELLWTTASVWNNSGDPGELRDGSGTVQATSL